MTDIGDGMATVISDSLLVSTVFWLQLHYNL